MKDESDSLLICFGLFGIISFVAGIILRIISPEGSDVLVVGGGYAMSLSIITHLVISRTSDKECANNSQEKK